jgi:hypothetical protein
MRVTNGISLGSRASLTVATINFVETLKVKLQAAWRGTMTRRGLKDGSIVPSEQSPTNASIALATSTAGDVFTLDLPTAPVARTSTSPTNPTPSPRKRAAVEQRQQPTPEPFSEQRSASLAPWVPPLRVDSATHVRISPHKEYRLDSTWVVHELLTFTFAFCCHSLSAPLPKLYYHAHQHTDQRSGPSPGLGPHLQ